jgi:hypothetical protein
VKKLAAVLAVLAVLALAALALWLALERAPARGGPSGGPGSEPGHEPGAPRPEGAPAPLEVPPSAPEADARSERPSASGAPGAASRPAPTASDTLRFHGRVIDGLTRKPIAGARAYAPAPWSRARASADEADPSVPEVLSDAEGRFALALPSGRILLAARLAAEGYGELGFVADAEHAEAARPETFELLPAAGLEVHVSAADGALVQGTRVDLVRPGETFMGGTGVLRIEDRRWSQHTDADGVARFAGLPAECELAWTVLVEEDSYGRAGRIALEPGATRRLDVRLGGHARLFGHVREEGGAPVPGLALWLARADETDARAREGMAKALSDEQGRFEFDDVPFESFVLGLSPGEEDYVAREELVLTVDQPLVERDLVVMRGLFLAGRVVGDEADIEELDFLNVCRPDGTFLAGKPLEGRAEFEIGPLLPGEYLVSASGHSAATEVVRAAAGARDVVLPLQPGQELRIRVEGVEGGCALEVRDLGRGTMYFWNHSGPELVHTFVPGRHALAATAAGDLVGLLGPIEVGGARQEGLVLRLERGARCTFVNHAAAGTRKLHLEVDGIPFPLSPLEAERELAAGAARTVLVPPRALVAELREGSRVVARQELSPAPGERLRIELTPR